VGFYTKGKGKQRKVIPITKRTGHKYSYRTPLSLRDVREIHESRSKRAKITDEALEAQITTNYEKWAKAPNKWDIRGVDFFPAPTVKGDFETNVKVLAYASEQYYNKELPNLKIYGYEKHNDYDKALGTTDAASKTAAYAKPELNELHFSPKTTKAIKRGKIETIDDFSALKAASHEIGHLMGETPTGTAFDEGTNELLATRFALNNIQMDKKLRENLRQSPPISYPDEVEMVWNTSLLINKGDEEKAIKWLTTFKTSDSSSKLKMREDAEQILASYEKDPTKQQKIKEVFSIPASNYPGGSWQMSSTKRRHTQQLILRNYPLAKTYGWTEV
jgi:hypothetical protein